MDFLLETFKNASLHVHAVWLALTYIAVILAMAIDFIAGLRKAKLAGQVTTSRALKMTTEKATKYFLPMLCLSCIDVLTSVVLPAPFFTMLMGAFDNENILSATSSSSPHQKSSFNASLTSSGVSPDHSEISRIIA